MKHYWGVSHLATYAEAAFAGDDMTPVSQLRGPSREHLAWPLFDSRQSEGAAPRIYDGATEVQKLIIGRDVLKA